MATILKADSRKDLKASSTRNLRKEGQVPAVLYGGEIENQTISVNAIELMKTIREVGRNGLISLEIENGSSHQVMIYEMQIDSIRNEYSHIDFFEVDMKTEIDVDVPVRLVGDAPGEREGGVVSQLLYEIGVKCLPTEIPDEIEVDISALNIGDAIQVADIRSSISVELTNEDEDAVVTVQAPMTEEEAEPSDDEAAEPEVIGEDKSEE